MNLKEQAFLRAMEQADPRFLREVAERIADPRRFTAKTGERDYSMKKQEKSQRRSAGRPAWGVWVAAGAVLLAAGGTTAAVAMYRHGEYTVDSSGISDELEEVTENSLGLKLTGQTDTPGIRGLAESENGFYFFKRSRQSDSSDQEHSEDRKVLFYSDKETGEVVRLCNRANCLHDGNEFCVATTSKYDQLVGAPVWFEGYLYTIAQKPEDQSVVLLRYEPDGSAITELRTFYEADTEHKINAQAELLAHRGYLWYTVSRNVCYQSDDPNLGTVSGDILYDYQLGAYDVKSGQATDVLSAAGQKNYYSLANPINLQGDGNYIYFEVLSASWGEQNGLTTGIWRLSCLNGETEELLGINVQIDNSYFVHGDRLFCQQQDEENTGIQQKWEYCLYDLTTGDRILTLKEDDFTDPSAGEGCTGFTADAEHFILLKQKMRQREQAEFAEELENGQSYLSYEVQSELWIYDWNGNLQKVEIDSEAEMKQQPELYTEQVYFSSVETINPLRMAQGTLYMQYQFGWYQMSVADALNGSPSLTPAFRHISSEDYKARTLHNVYY